MSTMIGDCLLKYRFQHTVMSTSIKTIRYLNCFQAYLITVNDRIKNKTNPLTTLIMHNRLSVLILQWYKFARKSSPQQSETRKLQSSTWAIIISVPELTGPFIGGGVAGWATPSASGSLFWRLKRAGRPMMSTRNRFDLVLVTDSWRSTTSSCRPHSAAPCGSQPGLFYAMSTYVRERSIAQTYWTEKPIRLFWFSIKLLNPTPILLFLGNSSF